MKHLFKTVSMALLLLLFFATISVAENAFPNFTKGYFANDSKIINIHAS